MSGWVYGPGGATTPGGSDKQIQFNDGGSFGGDADLTFDKAASTLIVTGSVRITETFYGDGSGLTGVTASAVNVADGPEFALQFRSNSPVSGELSGTANLMYSKGAVDTLHMTGNVRVGGDLNIISAGTASMSHLSGNSTIQVHSPIQMQTGLSLSFNGASNTAKITNNGSNLDINSPGSIVLNSGNSTITSSANLLVGGNLTIAGNSTFDGVVNLNAAVTSSDVIVSNVAAAAGPGIHLSASNTSFGPGQVYGQMFFGSGTLGGSGWSGTSISLSNFGTGEAFEFRAKNGAATVRADNGDATIRATAGEVILSGSAGIIGQTSVDLNAGLTTNNTVVSINAGMSVNNTALAINSSLVNNGISTFNDTATFNNSASVHNQGINVNNARGTFNSGLTVNNASAIFNDSVTLGDASGDGVTWNAGSWNMSANSVVTTLKDGVDGVGGNGALMFFTGSGGDFMKFHTSGSAKGIVFPQQTYLSKGGALSGSKAGPGSYLALDASNKIVLSTAGGAAASPGGSDGQIQFNQNGSFAGSSGLIYNGSGSISIGSSTKPNTALDVHYTGSGNPTTLSGDTGGGEIVYFGTGSLTNGALYYLNTAGGWAPTNAVLTGSGHNQLLGIALGADPRVHGVLVKGYYDAETYYIGGFIKGAPVYVCSGSHGRMTGSSPSAANSYVRVVGYGTSTPNVIYFNPDSTYVEIS